MRMFLLASTGLTLLATACSGSSGGTASSTGAASTGGATAGTTGGQLAAGSPCTENAACPSDVCGVHGTGNCCTTTCATSDATCGATSCDSTGACIYPTSATSCGATSCSGSLLSLAGTCDGSGTCSSGAPTACGGNFACQNATSCATACASSADCATGFVCNARVCEAQITQGSCTENDDCMSDVCGVSGTGHCCTTACTSTTAPCGATDCDAVTAACSFADAGTACGTVTETCTGDTQQNASGCDGAGNCDNSPGTTSCTPYICGNSACQSSCVDNTSCDTGDFCDVANGACCSGLTPATLAAIGVDSTVGSDATACCGIGGNGECQTIHQAMKLIDSAQVQNVTIAARVGGLTGGDWAPAHEVYPIVLGWGVVLSAPGLIFTDANGHAEIFDIANYSTSDTAGSASISGLTGSLVTIGMDSLGNQSTDSSAIEVEAGNTLYLANSVVNGSAKNKTTAITINAGGSLWLAGDQSGAFTGTVYIGNSKANAATDGYNGLVCLSANGLGCTIGDATSADSSGVVIEGQEGVDIDAEDNAVVTLTSAPIVGISPTVAGFKNCPDKPGQSLGTNRGHLAQRVGHDDIQQWDSAMHLGRRLRAPGGRQLQERPDPDAERHHHPEHRGCASTPRRARPPSRTATVRARIYDGVRQRSDGTNIASVDLSGGGAGTNTVVCSNSAESIHGAGGAPGVSVLNTTTSALDADDVEWDTNNNPSPPPDDPDLFSCNAALTTCTCENSAMSCTNAGGADGMDAVYTSTGTITQADAGLSNADCSVQTGGQKCGNGQPCPPGDCCNGLTFTCQVGQICPG